MRGNWSTTDAKLFQKAKQVAIENTREIEIFTEYRNVTRSPIVRRDILLRKRQINRREMERKHSYDSFTPLVINPSGIGYSFR